MAAKQTYTVKDVAGMTRVSIRTLHYYDEIGLLRPGRRSAAGYRLYEEDDLLRLQQVLINRALGLSLEDIRRSLDDPDFDYAQSLHRQRSRLVRQLDETNGMIAAIDRTLSGLAHPQHRIDFASIFDGFDPMEYVEEAENRWGNTNTHAESARRTKDYGEAEWQAIRDELDGIWKDAAALMQAETAPDAVAALEIAERHRQHICRWFYDLSPAAHVQLATMWESDERFRKNIDKYGEGLTDWVATAVRAAG